MSARQIVFDTETTGIEWQNGHRVIEIGAVEMVGRKLTGRRFHRYLNPEREIDAGAQAVHGLTAEFLADKPRFADIVEEFIEFIEGGELVIHNAAFDVGFINYEFSLIGREPLVKITSGVVDTLRMARELRPGKRNSLDALCSEYGVNNSGRQLHGALLDAELLAEVYLSMTRGQETLVMELDSPNSELTLDATSLGDRPPLKVLRASAAELEAHQAVLVGVDKDSKGKCIWLAAEERPA